MNARDFAVGLIERSGLDRADALIALLRPSIRITARMGNGDPRDGSSTFGGLPLLPDGVEWPHTGNRPLNLLADFRLSDLPEASGDVPLPRAGRLLFFYDEQVSPWGFDPGDRGGWRVVLTQDSQYLSRRSPTNGLATVFPPCSLTYAVGHLLPGDARPYGVDLHEYGSDDYAQLIAGLVIPGDGLHRIGGHPQAVQGDMELECQLVSNGIYCGDPSGYSDPRRSILEPGAKVWRLLLQLDSDDTPNWMWGDAGRLYFWIREDDLREANFDNVWCIQQCY